MTADANGLRIAYRVDKKGYAGSLINYTEHGGFVAADKLPSVGARIQMAVIGGEGIKPVWLDLRVTWVNAEPRGNMRLVGFGGQWLHACSKISADHLVDFLSAVLGMDSPALSKKGASNSSVFVYDFPQAVAVEAKKKKVEQQQAPAALTAATEGFKAPETFDNLPAIAAEEISSEVAETENVEESDTGSTADESRLVSFVKRLSGIRFRKSVSAEAVKLDFSGHSRLVIFKIGKKAYSGDMISVGASWLKLQTEDAVPELWTRIVIEVPLPSSSGKRSLPIEIQATVTRIKERSVKTADVLKGIELKGLHCKINRVNEKGQLGAFKQYVASFATETDGNSDEAVDS